MTRFDLARRLGAFAGYFDPSGRPNVIEEPGPAGFMAAFARAVAGDAPVVLADPAWGESERAALAKILGEAFDPSSPRSDSDQGDGLYRGWLLIPSGGTSGQLKFARHDEGTVVAAVRGFCRHFHVDRVNCVGTLPLHHVSGLMAWMRSALSGGIYIPWDWKRLEAGDRPSILADDSGGSRLRGLKSADAQSAREGWFLSLVPTQLQRLMGSPETVEWLRRFDAIFIGGGPAWPELCDDAQSKRLPISLSYGMTETAAMAAALRPAEFLSGQRSCGTALPHAAVSLADDGIIRISGASLFRGYYPSWRDGGEWSTGDLGRLDPEGNLSVLGRRDALIITGGEKVDPDEVEGALRATGLFPEVAVLGIADPEWGHRVVACYPSEQSTPDAVRLSELLSGLSSFKRPRAYIPISPWPRNAQGKLNRPELARLTTRAMVG